MDRLLQLGGDKKFLSYDDLNRELPENVVSPDDIEDVLQKLDASNIHVADSDERLIEQAATIAADDEESGDDELELDLSAGALEKTNDPVRLYLREMGVVPLLTREGEVAIAKRIERGQIKTQKTIARSPIAVSELLKVGEELAAGIINIREVVTFSEQAELAGEEDKADEYREWTIEGIENIRRLFKRSSFFVFLPRVTFCSVRSLTHSFSAFLNSRRMFSIPSIVHSRYSSALSSSPASSACSEKLTTSRMLIIPTGNSSPILRNSVTAIGERAIAF